MYVFHFGSDLQRYLSAQRLAHRAIGFVPTMGALHEGHLLLVRRAIEFGDLPVCSIFVNPTQFNDPNDLLRYPRTPEQDILLLAKAGCQVLFLPAVEEIYPPNVQASQQFTFGHLEKVMEGAFRPGHFQGVAQVVSRLLNLVQPSRLFMGQKDFQQTAIVASMLRQSGSPVDLRIVETMREADGLAMSSRNARLNPQWRLVAPVIYQTLKEAQRLYASASPDAICQGAMETLLNAGLRPEYFNIVDGSTLMPVTDPSEASFVVACTAAWAGDVRLIDNLIL
jgi:pantoate--beta-alanine ligase